MMKRKTITGALVSAALLVLLVIATADSRHTNLRYLMWKWGWMDYRPEVSLRYLNVDVPFRQSLNGLTKSEIRKWFPDLRVETKPDQYLDRSQPFYVGSPDFLWIGASQWAIEFEDEKVSGFALIKGQPQLEDRQVFSESAPSASSEKPSS